MQLSTISCRTCGAANRPQARFCINCGQTLPTAQSSIVYCRMCGAANRPQAGFCINCGQALPTTSSPPFAGQAALGIFSTPPAPTGLLPAHSLLKHRYRIISRLGEGGMGAVYKAADTELGGRLVAVKEMRQKGLDSQELAQAEIAFKQEALMLAGLFHPHLPRIYDHFAEGGHWYLVMDFIAGETLEEHLIKAGGKLPVEEVLEIGIQMATVLEYLHNHQPPIIFRDLKPSNIMCTLEGDLFLIDFGIARHFKAGKAKDTIASGTEGYAAPEQYGKAQTTPRSDIYSLGATLHTLLSGNDPSSNTPTLFNFPPLRPFNRSIPLALETLIMQMVEIDTNKRLASMTVVKQKLQHLQRLTAQP